MTCIGHGRCYDEMGILQQATSLLCIGSCQTDDDRHVGIDALERLQESLCHIVATSDTTEDIDQNHLHVLIAHQQIHGIYNLLRVRTATDVQEVGRIASIELDHVHGSHGKSGTIDHTTDITT